ncbi:MAG: hypothetical protein ABI972_23260 [Acidobacteriota bacterium]
MTLDQKLQLWNVIGTWLAGIATVGAVFVSLYLARSGARVRLHCYAGIRVEMIGPPGMTREHICIGVTNLADRTVTISLVGWAYGGRKKKGVSIQTFAPGIGDQTPKRIEHGDTAMFMVPLDRNPGWLVRFATEFITDKPIERALKTLVVQIHPSVGDVIEVKPERVLLDRIHAASKLGEVT